MDRHLHDRHRRNALGSDPPTDPAGPKDERLPPHLAVLAIGALSIGAWTALAVLARPLLHVL